MSESVTRGVATVAVSGCGQVLKSSAKVLQEAVTGFVNEMSEAAQRDYEYLLSVAPAVQETGPVSAHDALKDVQSRIGALQSKLVQSGYKISKPGILPIVALAGSSLGRATDRKVWHGLASAGSSAEWNTVLDDSARVMGSRLYDYTVNSVMEVASSAGFTIPIKKKVNSSKAVISLADERGRAVIAQISNSKTGVCLDLDLSGFNGDGCHEAMDRIIDGLKARDITIRQGVRKRHLDAGLLKLGQVVSRSAVSRGKSVSTTDERKRALELRRRSRQSAAQKVQRSSK